MTESGKIVEVDKEQKTPVAMIIEPFYGGSHRQLVETILKHIPQCRLITMTPKKWHWRARCSSLCLYNIIPQVTSEKVLFCSSVLNLAELLGIRPDLQCLKKIVYFHENQFVYPVQEIKNRDVQYCYNEMMTCLAADVILFNSHYNMNSLVEGLVKIIKLLPDYRPKCIKEIVEQKCRVLYFPVEYPPIDMRNNSFTSQSLLHILWPHRWEFDKDPEAFFNILYALKEDGLKFKVSVLGESFTDNPVIFEKAKEVLKDEIQQYGFVKTKSDYFNILQSCHVVVSTAKHEFFGVALLEAAYCGCFVLAPKRLVYPEIYPDICLYESKDQLQQNLKLLCREPKLASEYREKMNIDFHKYSVNALIPNYLQLFDIK